jgi:hypothetical protein
LTLAQQSKARTIHRERCSTPHPSQPFLVIGSGDKSPLQAPHHAPASCRFCVVSYPRWQRGGVCLLRAIYVPAPVTMRMIQTRSNTTTRMIQICIAPIRFSNSCSVTAASEPPKLVSPRRLALTPFVAEEELCSTNEPCTSRAVSMANCREVSGATPARCRAVMVSVASTRAGGDPSRNSAVLETPPPPGRTERDAVPDLRMLRGTLTPGGTTPKRTGGGAPVDKRCEVLEDEGEREDPRATSLLSPNEKRFPSCDAREPGVVVVAMVDLERMKANNASSRT